MARPKTAPTPEESRARLFDGRARALAAKGYARATVADVVRHARVSRRTFYEHFEGMEDCFLLAYQDVSWRMLEAIGASVDPRARWEDQVHAAVATYLRLLEENPALTRTFLLEIHAAGRGALVVRRAVHRRFAEVLVELVESARDRDVRIRPLSAELATALVGGIHELVLDALEEGREERLSILEDAASELVRAVLLAPPPRRRKARR